MSRRRWILTGTIAAVVLAVGAVWGSFHVAPAPSGFTSKTEHVSYYPACGSDVLEVGKLTWYPIYREWQGPSPSAFAVTGGRGVAVSAPRVVAPPGPGDDVGTLYVYPQAVAYWVSDSGDLDQWLTLVPQRYGWVC